MTLDRADESVRDQAVSEAIRVCIYPEPKPVLLNEARWHYFGVLIRGHFWTDQLPKKKRGT